MRAEDFPAGGEFVPSPGLEVDAPGRGTEGHCPVNSAFSGMAWYGCLVAGGVPRARYRVRVSGSKIMLCKVNSPMLAACRA